MSERDKKTFSSALITLMIAFLTFWGIQSQTCASSISKLNERIGTLEEKSERLQSLKAKSDLFVVKLEYELERTETRLDVIENYLDALPIPAWIKRRDADGNFRMILINKAYADKYKISKHRYQGSLDSEVWPKDIANKFKIADEKVIMDKSHVRVIEQVIEDGEQKQAVIWKFYVELTHGQGVGGVVTC